MQTVKILAIDLRPTIEELYKMGEARIVDQIIAQLTRHVDDYVPETVIEISLSDEDAAQVEDAMVELEYFSDFI